MNAKITCIFESRKMFNKNIFILGSFYCYIADYQSNFFVDKYI